MQQSLPEHASPSALLAFHVPQQGQSGPFSGSTLFSGLNAQIPGAVTGHT